MSSLRFFVLLSLSLGHACSPGTPDAINLVAFSSYAAAVSPQSSAPLCVLAVKDKLNVFIIL